MKAFLFSCLVVAFLSSVFSVPSVPSVTLWLTPHAAAPRDYPKEQDTV